MPWKQWAYLEKVTSADFQTYLQDQVVPQFTTPAQRDAQWTAPPNGALCVTVDTNTLWQRVSGSWSPFKGWGSAWGVVAAAKVTADQGSIGTGTVDLTGFSLTWTANPARRYRYLISLQIANSAANVATTISITTAANADIDGSGFVCHSVAGGGNGEMVTRVQHETALSGSITRKLRAVAGAPTTTIKNSQAPGLFIVEDAGPFTNP